MVALGWLVCPRTVNVFFGSRAAAQDSARLPNLTVVAAQMRVEGALQPVAQSEPGPRGVSSEKTSAGSGLRGDATARPWQIVKHTNCVEVSSRAAEVPRRLMADPSGVPAGVTQRVDSTVGNKCDGSRRKL